jgi:predicted outer membrane lipoprotein
MVDLTEIQAAYYLVAATGVLLAAAFYIINIKAQNRNREAQLFMNITNQSFNNPNWNKAFLVVDRAKWSSAKEFIELNGYPNETEFNNAYGTLVGFFEGLGVFVREGLVDIRLVALLMTGYTKGFFEKISPYLEEVRVIYDMPRMLSETEYLYNRLMKYLEEHPEIKT